MDRLRRFVRSMIVILLLIILAFICLNHKIVSDSAEREEEIIDEIAEARKSVIGEEPQMDLVISPTEMEKLTRDELIKKMKEELPNYRVIETEPILQYPELPTGCESVALTMALESIGYDLEKTEIADDYLIYSVDNFAEGYMGDPYSEWGAGIYPPGVVATANAFLEENSLKDTDGKEEQYAAHDISGTAFLELFPYIAAGSPVLIWITSDYQTPIPSDIYVEYEDEEYWWYMNEHCVMLGGYNEESGNVLLYDPLQGLYEIPTETIDDIYTEAGSYAVSIY